MMMRSPTYFSAFKSSPTVLEVRTQISPTKDVVEKLVNLVAEGTLYTLHCDEGDATKLNK